MYGPVESTYITDLISRNHKQHLKESITEFLNEPSFSIIYFILFGIYSVSSKSFFSAVEPPRVLIIFYCIL